MAVSVDRVYQTVLALANKEQRGYITPQEFNLFANHAQNEIFEQYFYDLNQFLRSQVGNKTVSSDLRDITEEKISIFRIVNSQIGTSLPSDLYKLETIKLHAGGYSGNSYVAEEVTKKEYEMYEMTALTRPPINRPIFYRSGNSIYSSPQVGSNQTYSAMTADYIRRPNRANWTYVTVQGAAIWNPTVDTQNFQLHDSEEKNLVVKILALSGLAIKDMDLAQTGAGKEAFYIQQEKS